jgi:hypothetical protein
MKLEILAKKAKDSKNYIVYQIVPSLDTKVEDLKQIRADGTILPVVGTLYLSTEYENLPNDISFTINIKSKKKSSKKICKQCDKLDTKRCPYSDSNDKWDINDPEEACKKFKLR